MRVLKFTLHVGTDEVKKRTFPGLENGMLSKTVTSPPLGEKKKKS